MTLNDTVIGSRVESTALSARVVDTLADLDKMSGPWRQLEQLAADPLTYFQSFAWCRTWAEHFAADSGKEPASSARRTEMRIVAVYQGGQLILVWPLMVNGSRNALRTVSALSEPLAQYGNLIINPCLREPSALADAIQTGWTALLERERPDAFDFSNVPAAAFPATVLTEAPFETCPGGQNSAFDLSVYDNFDDYRSKMKSSTRRARNKRRNKFAKLGRVDYMVRFAGDPGYRELVRDGVAMKQRWLSETGRATRTLRDPNVIDFLCALPINPNGGSGAAAFALTLDGRPVSIEIGFSWFGRFYSWLGAFDWDLRDYSPGKIQLEESIRWCLAQGLDAYDLLGDPSTYKDNWSNVCDPLIKWRAAPTLRGRVYLSVWNDRLLPILKNTLASLPPGLKASMIPIAERHLAKSPGSVSVGPDK